MRGVSIILSKPCIWLGEIKPKIKFRLNSFIGERKREREREREKYILYIWNNVEVLTKCILKRNFPLGN